MNCKECNKEYKPKWKFQKYCSQGCYQAVNRRKAYQRQQAKRMDDPEGPMVAWRNQWLLRKI